MSKLMLTGIYNNYIMFKGMSNIMLTCTCIFYIMSNIMSTGTSCVMSTGISNTSKTFTILSNVYKFVYYFIYRFVYYHDYFLSNVMSIFNL